MGIKKLKQILIMTCLALEDLKIGEGGREMHNIIKNILDSNITNQKKMEEIEAIKESIIIAEQIFTGKFAYCKTCKDYFLSKSFFEDTEIVNEKVCTYIDPINSGGDQYENRPVRYTYKYCPKGCKHKIKREEHW